MPIVYILHLSKSRNGFRKPRVDQQQQMLAGHLDTSSGEIVGPDLKAVREALPHYYRKAFDNAGQFWFRAERGSGKLRVAYCTLNNRRMKWLNTLYAIPKIEHNDENASV
jgi:hypothetical protein